MYLDAEIPSGDDLARAELEGYVAAVELLATLGEAAGVVLDYL